MNNVITASRMNAVMRCLRQHYWAYEIGLRREETGLALRIGSAWARAMEARWNKATYDEALAVAIPEGVELDAYACATVGALLAGYYDHYGRREKVGKLNPEVQFKSEVWPGSEFTAQGKIDGLGSMKTGESVVLEGKTTRDSLDPNSDYWLRLRFNMQILGYVVEARKLGWDVRKLFYDVTRKPSIRPKQIVDLDASGKKIVLDANNKRVYKVVKGKKVPVESGSKSKCWRVKSHLETPDEFCNRLWFDTKTRPDFYYQRKEVAILDDELEKFEHQRFAIIRIIEGCRSVQGEVAEPEDAWPRNVSRDTCNFCSYKSFCLSNHSIDIKRPPEGFAVKPFNPELAYEPSTETDDATEQADSAT